VTGKVSLLIITGDQAHHHCVIRKLTMALDLDLATQSCVYREYSMGLRTHTWGDPVFKVRGLAVRKSRIQAHRGVFRTSSISFLASLLGTMVLKAELKSMNNILTYPNHINIEIKILKYVMLFLLLSHKRLSHILVRQHLWTK